MKLDMSRFGGEVASTAASGHKTTGIHVCLLRRRLRLAPITICGIADLSAFPHLAHAVPHGVEL